MRLGMQKRELRGEKKISMTRVQQPTHFERNMAWSRLHKQRRCLHRNVPTGLATKMVFTVLGAATADKTGRSGVLSAAYAAMRIVLVSWFSVTVLI
jgi:hypothetical protein